MFVSPSNSATPTLAVTGIWCSAEHRRLAAQRLDDAVRDHLCLLRVDLRQDDPELVAAQPGQDVGLAHPAAKRRGDGLEQVVARACGRTGR